LGVIFEHDVDHAPTNKLKAGLFNFVFFKSFLKEGRLSVCLHILSNTRLKFKWKTVTLSGASQKCHFPHYFCRNQLTYKKPNVGDIS